MLRGLPARLEEGIDRRTRDLREARRAPVRLVVLFHDEGADALDEIALLEAAVDEVQFHAEAFRERERGAAPQLLERDREHRGRALRERFERLRGPLLQLGMALRLQ